MTRLAAWLAQHDWDCIWRVWLDDVGRTREGEYPYCLTPWFTD